MELRARAMENREGQGNSQGQVVPARDDVARREITFVAEDGHRLGGILFEAGGTGPLVLVSSATAVPMGLYAGFATHLAGRGARAVLIYDHRGTGRSRASDKARRRIAFSDWALMDFPAAVAALDGVAPGHPMVGVGQSFGGQAFGLSGESARFQRFAMVATMSGYHRLVDDRTVWPRMNLIGVPASYLFADIPRWLGIGEPIPSSVFRDWARWCRMPNYFFDDPALRAAERFARVTTPILSIGLTDDPWGTPRATRHFLERFSNAPVETAWISPADAGGRPIGHLGFFRSRFTDSLWPMLADWLLDPSQSIRWPARTR